jgi:hypothetical protein
MFKLILIVLVLLGFITAHPPTRSRIASAAAPALEKLGPVGAYALRPVHGFTAQNEVDFIADQIKLANEVGRETPKDDTFQDWLVKRRVTTRNSGKDPWGAPYYLTRKDKRFTVGSLGPDGRKNTEDDIIATGTL